MRQHPWLWVAVGLVLAFLGVSWYVGRVNSSHPAPWPMVGGDSGHRNYSAAPFPTNPKLLWSLPLGREQQVTGPVIWQDGTLYVAAGSRVMAVDRNGKRLWAWESKSQVTSLALGRQGELYVLTPDTVFALGADGAPIWQADVIAGEYGSLLVGQGGVIYASGSEYVYALTSSGKRKWRFKGDNITVSPVELTNGNLAVTVGAELYILNRDGDTEWHRPVGTPAGFMGVAAGPDGRVFVNSGLLNIFEANGNNRRVDAFKYTNLGLAVGKDFVQDGITRLTFTGAEAWTKPPFGFSGSNASTMSVVDSQGNALLVTGPSTGLDARRGVAPLQMVGPHGTEMWRFAQVQVMRLPAVSADSRICFVGMQPGAVSYALYCIGDR